MGSGQISPKGHPSYRDKGVVVVESNSGKNIPENVTVSAKVLGVEMCPA